MRQRTWSLRTVAAYAPLAVLVTTAVAAWTVFLRGRGLSSVYAWGSLAFPIPLLAFLVVAGTIIARIVTRKKARGPDERLGRRVRLAATVAAGAVCLWPALWNVNLAVIRFPFALDDTHPTVTARLPTNATMRVIWGGDQLAQNHHAPTPDQRWAYDLVVEPALVRSERLEDSGCFGVPVVAPVSGVVRIAHDGEPDRAVTPGRHEANYTAPLGNHVAIALDGGGAYVLVAHLKQGSVVVREGEHVSEGTPIGACGNSGNTSEPHVHIHAQRQDPLGRPLNFSEGLPLFFHHHDGAAMPTGGVAIVDGKRSATGAVVRHVGPGGQARHPAR